MLGLLKTIVAWIAVTTAAVFGATQTPTPTPEPSVSPVVEISISPTPNSTPSTEPTSSPTSVPVQGTPSPTTTPIPTAVPTAIATPQLSSVESRRERVLSLLSAFVNSPSRESLDALCAMGYLRTDLFVVTDTLAADRLSFGKRYLLLGDLVPCNFVDLGYKPAKPSVARSILLLPLFDNDSDEVRAAKLKFNEGISAQIESDNAPALMLIGFVGNSTDVGVSTPEFAARQVEDRIRNSNYELTSSDLRYLASVPQPATSALIRRPFGLVVSKGRFTGLPDLEYQKFLGRVREFLQQ